MHADANNAKPHTPQCMPSPFSLLPHCLPHQFHILSLEASYYQRDIYIEREREVMITIMNCIKILVLVSLIPLVLRGASLLGNVVAVIPLPSPEQQSDSKNAASVGVSAPQVEHWRHRRRRKMEQRRLTAFTPRRFGGGNGGPYGDFFQDEKRFAPTGSNPLHNL